ncbi:MAG: GTP-binding protein, partial [Nonlabens ulvanivorans]|uniref:CobW family GTP-binding protein n=1 Tax=Nonlabens ulvanivorans TaxID=906888 RepID=UPI0032662336
RWAVLVNEFGEIGVDGSLLGSQISNAKNVFIQEVSGGCMCCSSSLTMKVALNRLLKDAQPHRLLIEPTGLGHPIEVLETLSNQFYKDVLSIEKTITLVDARNLSDTRYTEHIIFNQQLLIADTIVGSKTDLCNEQDKQALINYGVSQKRTRNEITFIEHGQLPIELLAGKTQYLTEPEQHCHSHDHKHTHDHSHDHEDHSHSESNESLLNETILPLAGFIKAVNSGEGFQSIGWRFASNKTFDRKKLQSFIGGLQVTRLKAVFITNEGNFGFNATEHNSLTLNNLEEVETKLAECNESRIEIISHTINEDWGTDLLNCLSE